MLQEATQIISGIVSLYFWLLMLYAGAVCIFFVAPYIRSGGFKTEAAISFVGGIVYILGGTILFVVVRMVF